MLVDARGMTNLAHEMRQNTETWFTRMREYLNTIFKKFSIYICLLKSQNNAVVFWNVLTNLEP